MTETGRRQRILTVTGKHIYLFDGKPAAYLNEDAVYGFGAPSMDGLRRGWIRDLDGYCVMFTEEARTQGPAKPSRHETPAKWARAARPVRRSRGDKTLQDSL